MARRSRLRALSYSVCVISWRLLISLAEKPSASPTMILVAAAEAAVDGGERFGRGDHAFLVGARGAIRPLGARLRIDQDLPLALRPAPVLATDAAHDPGQEGHQGDAGRPAPGAAQGA